MGRVIFPCLTPDRKRVIWFSVDKGGISQSVAPKGLMLPNIAALRLIEMPGENEPYLGVKMMTSGSVERIEGAEMTRKMLGAICQPYWVRVRPFDLREDNPTGMTGHGWDIVYLSFKCPGCGKLVRPIDGLDPANPTAWEMKCGACRNAANIPTW